MLIVIVILGVLAGIVVFAVGNLTSTSKQHACATEAQSFFTAFHGYRAAAKGNSPGLGTDVAGSRDQVVADLIKAPFGTAPTPNPTYSSNGPFIQRAPNTRPSGYWDDADSFVSSGSLTLPALQSALNTKAAADKQPEWGFVPSSGQIAQSQASTGYACA
jgi:type II secretory pathway pseudopilin PulG